MEEEEKEKEKKAPPKVFSNNSEPLLVTILENLDNSKNLKLVHNKKWNSKWKGNVDIGRWSKSRF